MNRRVILIAVLGGIMLALGGCVLATPEPTPMPSTISTSPPATTSPTPEALPTPESSLTPPESSDFTRDQLIDLCITDSTEFSGMENRVADTDLALVERRAVDPPWFVYIRVTDSTPGLASPNFAFLCVYGGTADNPFREVSGTFSLQTDAEIAIWLTSNDLIGDV